MLLVGVDEVGRGCWAGPLVAAAVLLRAPIEGLKDSKLLSKKRREELDKVIRAEALAYGVGWVDPATIDLVGITTSVKMAMEAAIKQIEAPHDSIVVDGNYNFLSAYPNSVAVIKADLTVPAVSAASIIAKVARDKYMEHAALRLPEYAFEKHVGYGTAAHLAALQLHGVTDLHRLSYKPIQKILAVA